MNAVKEKFVPDNEYNIHAYAEIVNYQNNGDVIVSNTRAWLTNVYTGRYLNNYIGGKIKKDILKRVIINGETGSSWTFKMFTKLHIIAVPKTEGKNLISS